MAESPQSLAPKLVQMVAAGTRLFTEGDLGEEMYLIQSGQVKVTRTVGGVERTLAVLGPGEFVGEMAIFTGEPRSGTAVAVEDSRVVPIDGDMLETLIVKNGEIAVRLLKRLAYRLQSANELIEVLLHRDERARVVMGLLLLLDDGGEERPDGTFVAADLQKLANRVGLRPDQVVEVLKRLEPGGMLKRVEGGVLVQDLPRMREFTEFLSNRESVGDLEL